MQILVLYSILYHQVYNKLDDMQNLWIKNIILGTIYLCQNVQ